MTTRTKIAAIAIAFAALAAINTAPAEAASFNGLAQAGQAASSLAAGSQALDGQLQTVGFKHRRHFRFHYRPHYSGYDCYTITFWKHGRKYWKRICD